MSSNISDHFIKPRSGSQKRLNGFPFDESKRNSRSSKSSMSSIRDCLFCGKSFRQGPQRQQFTALVNRALYAKYSSSQNYYYTKDINDFLSEARTPAVVTLKDYIHLDEEEEYLKRFYYANEYDFKIKMLTEYYKFHNDIPRMFIMPVTHVVNRYHDKKRRLEYIRVTKMLKEEQDMQSPDAKHPEEKHRPSDYTITDRILDDLNFTATEPSELRRDTSPMKTDHPYFGKTTGAKGGQQQQKKQQQVTTKNNNNNNNNMVNRNNPLIKGKTTKPQQQQELNQSKDMSISNTIQDLNLKLGEIISNSRSHHFDVNYLENSASQASATMSNLEDFLMFFDKNQRNLKSAGISTADVMKPIPKTLTSVPLTERLSRPETPFSIAQAKQAMKRDMMVRASDSIKLVSPRSNRTTAKTTKNADKSKEKQEIATTRPTTAQLMLERPKGSALVTKIKNFEEALKPTPHIAPFHQKSATLTSLPRDLQRETLQDKTASTSISKNTSRVATSKTPRRQPEKAEKGEKSQESSLISKQRIQLYSSASSRPQSTSRTKTKSSENTKNLDLVIGNDQILLGNNTSGKRREIATQAQSHRSTKNAFTFKVKTPSETNFSQHEKSMGKENIRIESATTKVSLSRLAFENLGMQTEREMKKIGAFGNLDLLRKDFGQAPLSERQLSKESLHKSKEFYKKPTKGVRATALMPTEPENVRLEAPVPAPVEHKKLGMHKYTKSECRIKKPEVEKIDIINNVRNLLADGGGSKPSISSPRRQNYVYSSNSNLASAFSNSGTTSKKYERPTALKSDRQHYQDALLLRDEGDNFAKMLRSKSPKYEAMAKSTTNLARKSNAIVHGIDYKQQDFSPLRSNRKEGLITSHTRVLSERSPPNFSVAFPH